MTIPSWIMKLAAAAVIPAAIGMGSALSAPSPALSEPEAHVQDTQRPASDGIDYAAITGPRAPRNGNVVPACADPERRGDLLPCLK